ncbi:hypothetical protein D3C87_181040 [compost metagenome]
MILRSAIIIMCLTATYSWSQGYSGKFKVSENKVIYHFTLVNGSLRDPVYTIMEDTKHVNTMYLSDSVIFSDVDSLMVLYKKDSLLKHFQENFTGTYVEYKKNRMKLSAHRYGPCTDSTTDICETQRMNFYPNGKPYAQFYLKNGHPARSVVYYTSEGEVRKITDLSEYPAGEEVLIRNPWNFRMRKKMLRLTIQ